MEDLRRLLGEGIPVLVPAATLPARLLPESPEKWIICPIMPPRGGDDAQCLGATCAAYRPAGAAAPGCGYCKLIDREGGAA